MYNFFFKYALHVSFLFVQLSSLADLIDSNFTEKKMGREESGLLSGWTKPSTINFVLNCLVGYAAIRSYGSPHQHATLNIDRVTQAT